MIVHSPALDALAAMPDESVDAVITDPPYGLEFLGARWQDYVDGDPARRVGWDTLATDAKVKTARSSKFGGVAYGKRRTTFRCETCGKRDTFRQPHGDCPVAWAAEWVDAEPFEARAFARWTQEWATAALRVLKPGGHLLCFGAARTHHRAAIGVEEAGYELRDTLLWLYGTGHPKSYNVGAHLEQHDHPQAQAWAGWGTALKPAYEPIILARRLMLGGIRENIDRYGVGALNVTGCQLEVDRWPSTLTADGLAAGLLDAAGPPDSPSSRLAYVAKPSVDERVAGLGENEELHPTVKPVDLVRLVCPPGGVVLDPFAGSGTTGVAAYLEGCSSILVDHDAQWADVARRRLEWWQTYGEPGMSTDAVLDGGLGRDRALEAGQLDIFAP